MSWIAYTQIGISILLIILILLQERSSNAGGIFGAGGGDNSFYQTRRGMEKVIFVLTITLIVAFASLALLNLVV